MWAKSLDRGVRTKLGASRGPYHAAAPEMPLRFEERVPNTIQSKWNARKNDMATKVKMK